MCRQFVVECGFVWGIGAVGGDGWSHKFRFIGLFEIPRHQSVTCAMGEAVKWEDGECCEFA